MPPMRSATGSSTPVLSKESRFRQDTDRPAGSPGHSDLRGRKTSLGFRQPAGPATQPAECRSQSRGSPPQNQADSTGEQDSERLEVASPGLPEMAWGIFAPRTLGEHRRSFSGEGNLKGRTGVFLLRLGAAGRKASCECQADRLHARVPQKQLALLPTTSSVCLQKSVTSR